MLADAQVAQATLIELRVVLRHLLHDGFVCDLAVKAAVKSFLVDTMYVLPGTLGTTEQTDWLRYPAAETWRRAREALTRDPDAELPVSAPGECGCPSRSILAVLTPWNSEGRRTERYVSIDNIARIVSLVP
jgi:hypothetical protein